MGQLNVAWVVRGTGSERRFVRLGQPTADGQVEILSGLEAGDEIVTSGQFLIDSESSLRASFQRMSGD